MERKHKILKVLLSEEAVSTPEIDGWQMITCSNQYILGVSFTQYEYVQTFVNLCDSNRFQRINNEVIEHTPIGTL